MDTYWCHSSIDENANKIDLLREYLTDNAAHKYDAKIESSGPFETHKDLTAWLREHYSTIDPINTYRDRFYVCYQKHSEFFDDYFQCFLTVKNSLNIPLLEMHVVYLFVAHL